MLGNTSIHMQVSACGAVTIWKPMYFNALFGSNEGESLWSAEPSDINNADIWRQSLVLCFSINFDNGESMHFSKCQRFVGRYC
jgi:hypothetical protein